MKTYFNLLLLVSVLFSVAPIDSFALETGPANTVLRIPGAGGRPRFGALDLSQSASVTNQLPVSKGGTGIATSSANTVFSGPTSGSAAAPSFRTMVVADLPAEIFGYRKPVLQFVNTTTVDVENNTGNANETKIQFPDGTTRTVVENTGTTDKYRRFIISATAQFTTGTEDSGLRSSLTAAANTWYAIYAVKSLIDSTKFVLVGDTVTPTQANYTTLNSNFGSNGWVYLGMIRYGDQASATTSILNFTQVKNRTSFKNTLTLSSTLAARGIQFATASAGTATWTAATGTNGQVVPSHVLQGIWYFDSSANAAYMTTIKSNSNFIAQLGSQSSGQATAATFEAPADQSISITTSGGTNNYAEIALVSFFDSIL